MGNSHSDEAIKLAVEGRWEEAVAINQNIIEISPGDIDAHNRLGKAFAELGQNGEARKAYERVLELDPNNRIARRNLDRLSYLKDKEQSSKEKRGIDCSFFIQDTSKARMADLLNVAPKETLAKISAGDEIRLEAKRKKLVLLTNENEYVGEVESKVGSRLIELMKGGNQYRAAVISLRDDAVKVIIRETFQHPGQLGQPSFLPGVAEEFKPYLKGTLVKHDIEEDISDDMEEDGDWGGEEIQDDMFTEDGLPSIEKEDAGRVVS